MDPLARLRGASVRVRLAVVGLTVVLLVSAAGAAAFGLGGLGGTTAVVPTPTAVVTTPTPTPTPSPLPTSTRTPTPTPPPTPGPSPTPNDLAHHPFTVLVLGGDDGLRTDAIVVVGIHPFQKTVAYASIPRDTIDAPLPGGGVFRAQKINAFYNYAAANPRLFPQGPGRATADMVGLTLGITIDYYALTWFGGFTNLVKAIGGVPITLPSAVVDPFYQVTSTQIGVVFPAGRQTLTPTRALIFVRTRQGDNDFKRAERQQLLLTAAGQSVLAKPALLPALLAAATRNLLTDFPVDQVPLLLGAMAGFDPASVHGIVLGPSSYSFLTPCVCGYALEPKLPAMRGEAAGLFPWALAPGGGLATPSPNGGFRRGD